MPPSDTSDPPAARASTKHDLAALAALPAWSIATLLALPGQTRGVQLHDWAAQIARRFGASAVATLRSALGAPLAAVGDAPERSAWLPIGLPLAVHRTLVEQQFGGDWRALQAPLRDDALAQIPTLARWSVRAAGLPRVFERVPSLHGWLYDQGHADVEQHGDGASGSATLRVTGGGLFACPHWALEQLYALETLGEVCGVKLDAHVALGVANDAQAVTTIALRWRRSD